MGIIIHLYTI